MALLVGLALGAVGAVHIWTSSTISGCQRLHITAGAVQDKWSNSTLHPTEMLKAVDGATEKDVKHARAASMSILHSTKAALATGSADEVLGSPYQRHEGIKHEAASTTMRALSPNVSGSGLLPCVHARIACSASCIPAAEVCTLQLGVESKLRAMPAPTAPAPAAARVPPPSVLATAAEAESPLLVWTGARPASTVVPKLVVVFSCSRFYCSLPLCVPPPSSHSLSSCRPPPSRWCRLPPRPWTSRRRR